MNIFKICVKSHASYLFGIIFFVIEITILQTPITVAQTVDEKAYSVDVAADRDGAKYQTGETVAFRVRVLQKTKPLADRELTYTVTGDGGYRKTGKIVSAEEAVPIEAKLDRPGMLRCAVQWKTPAGKVFIGHAGAAVDPLKIVAARPEPEDFDRYWAEQKQGLGAVPMNPRLTPVDVEKYKQEGVEVFDVQVDCAGGAPVSGYLAKPIGAKPKSLPIIVNYHGAGVNSAAVPLVAAKKGAIAFDVNAHGIPNGQSKEFYNELREGSLKDYSRRKGSETYFLGMLLRVMRSLEFVKSLPEWDGKILAVTGSSQGGGQALAAAGLDPDVNICCAYVPAKCYHSGHLDQEFGGWPGFLRPQGLEPEPELIKRVAYIDAATLSKRSKAETLVTVGYIDYTCSATSVYVAYNNLRGPKQILEYPRMAHSTPKGIRDRGNDFIWKCINTLQKNR